MLEALVSLRRTSGTGEIGGAERGLKKAGDIIVVKVSPAVWGSEERKHFLIVKLKDDALEAEIAKNDGVIIHPYSEMIDTVMVTRCSKPVDLTTIPADSPGLDAKVESGPIDVGAKGFLEPSDLKSASML